MSYYCTTAIPEFPSSIFSITGMCVPALHTLNHSVSFPLFVFHFPLFFVFLSFRKALAFATWPVSQTGQQHQQSDRNPLSLCTVSPKRHSFQPMIWWGRRNGEAFPDSQSRCWCVSADKITSRSCRNHALFRPTAMCTHPVKLQKTVSTPELFMRLLCMDPFPYSVWKAGDKGLFVDCLTGDGGD